MHKIEFVTNETTGAVINPTKNPEFGYVVLRQTENTVASGLGGSWARKTVRTAIVQADMETLTNMVVDMQARGIKGKIFVKEFVESELPEEARNLTNLQTYLKRAGNTEDAPVCTLHGEPIYQFKLYMEDTDKESNPEAFDKLVKHDNGDAIRAYRMTQRTAANANANANAVAGAGAELPA